MPTAAVWDSIPADTELYSAVFQEYFSSTSQQVLAIFKAAKVAAASSASRRISKEPDEPVPALLHTKEADLRILVLTVVKLDANQGPEHAVPRLHRFGVVRREGRLVYQPRGSPFKLTILRALHILDSADLSNGIVLGTVWAAEARAAQNLPTLPAPFVQPTPGHTPFHYRFESSSHRMVCVACLFCAARAFTGSLPALHGIEVGYIDTWLRKHSHARPPNVVPSILERYAFDADAVGKPLEWTSLTQNDEDNMTGLLMLLKGASNDNLDVSAIRDDLEHQQAKLAAANVHAILESERAQPAVLRAIDDALNSLLDLEELQRTFDSKLELMRGDIAAIEKRNNLLEMQQRSLKGLSEAVQELQSNLQIPPEISQLTDNLDIGASNNVPSSGRILRILEGLAAAKERMVACDPAYAAGRGPQSRAVLEMQVFEDYRTELHGVVDQFLHELGKHLQRMWSLTEVFNNELVPAEHPLLRYHALVVALREVPKGRDVLEAAQRALLQNVSLQLETLIRSNAVRAEKELVNNFDHEARQGAMTTSGALSSSRLVSGTSGHVPFLMHLRRTIPPVVHAHIFVADLLQLRPPPEVLDRSRRRSDKHSNPAASGSRRPSGSAAQEFPALRAVPEGHHAAMHTLNAVLERMRTAPSRRRSSSESGQSPFLSMQELMCPLAPVSDSGAAMLRSMAPDAFSDHFSKPLKAAVRTSFFALVPIIAELKTWTSFLTHVPAATVPLTDLASVTRNAEGLLSKQLEALIGAIKRQEAARSTFGPDTKSVKGLGILRGSQDISALISSAAAFVNESTTPLRWHWPWGPSDDAVPANADRSQALPMIGHIFERVFKALLDRLATLAARDPKHGSQLVLENLHYLEPGLSSLAGKVPDLAVTAADVSAALKRQLDSYVQLQLEHSKLWPVLSRASKLQVLLKDVSPQEVPYQAGFSAQATSMEIEAGLETASVKVNKMGQRVRKQLGSNQALVDAVCDAIHAAILTPLRQLENDLRVCYGDLRLPVTCDQMKEILRTTPF